MATTFASQEWAQELERALTSSAQVRTECMTWIFGPLLIMVSADVEHGFDATGIKIDLHEGEARSVEIVDPQTAPRVPFVISGNLQRWKAVFGGSLAIVDAIRESKLQSKGDLPTLTRHAALWMGIAQAAGTIDTAWQDEVDAQQPEQAGVSS